MRGGITIVGRRGIVAHTVAPPTLGDLSPSASALGSVPAAPRSVSDTPSASGPRIYTSDRGSGPGGDYRRWDLQFYNYDANPTEAIRRLNKGLANDPGWASRPWSGSGR